jgi:hypothetical protein
VNVYCRFNTTNEDSVKGNCVSGQVYADVSMDTSTFEDEGTHWATRRHITEDSRPQRNCYHTPDLTQIDWCLTFTWMIQACGLDQGVGEIKQLSTVPILAPTEISAGTDTHTHTHTHTYIYIYIYRMFSLKVDRILIWVIYLLRFKTCYITQLNYIYSKCWKWCPFISMHLSTRFTMFLATFLSVLLFFNHFRNSNFYWRLPSKFFKKTLYTVGVRHRF